MQKAQKCCLFRNFTNFVQSVSKNLKKKLFSHTFCGTSCKKLKKRCFFRIYCELCTKCLEKREKNTVFSHFLQGIVQKAQKRCFFAFFANFVQSVSKNVKKHCFLTLFEGHRAKSSKNAFFSYICRSEMNSAQSKIFDFFFFCIAMFCGSETRHFLPQLALCCDCVRCYSTKSENANSLEACFIRDKKLQVEFLE